MLAKLVALGNAKRARGSSLFFKTGPGEYAEGDKFLGIAVPVLRKLLKEEERLTLAQAQELVESEYHEARLFGLLCFVDHYTNVVDDGEENEDNNEEDNKEEARREAIYAKFVDNFAYVNNWDLVDSTAPQIVGRHLLEYRTPKQALDQVLEWQASSQPLWTRRISVLATFPFIKRDLFDPILKVSTKVLANREEHDLIHKAVGWMLREMGKRDETQLVAFLDANSEEMPRVMLRYSLEKLSPTTRQHYLGTRGGSKHSKA
ncbi:hypothetical protein BASA81_007742 [Batrachochytrium salamandrivorans]|nr:hypothetical protein BASA81_007742 [Batrachochytrium salamandrivorans]